MDASLPSTTLTGRPAGTLLGTALGDALGLPAEGMSARAVARRFGRVDRFRLLGRAGASAMTGAQAARFGTPALADAVEWPGVPGSPRPSRHGGPP